MCPGYIKKKKRKLIVQLKVTKDLDTTEKKLKIGNVIKKCNLKLQRDTTTYPVEWLRLKRLTTASFGKDVEQIEIS